jgi:hypothetical protein
MPDDLAASPERDAVILGQQACAVHEQIKAMRLQQEQKVPWQVTLERMPRLRLDLPDADGEPGSAKSRGTAKSESAKIEAEMDAAASEGVGGPVSPPVGKTPKDRARMQKTLRAVETMLGSLLTSVDRPVRGNDFPPVTIGDAGPADPGFGPWSVSLPLPAAGTTGFSLPTGQGVSGPQVWSFIPVWEIIGPFPIGLLPTAPQDMDDVVADPVLALLVQREALAEFLTKLKPFAKVEIIELPEREDCCGFGGVFSVEHPELSAEFLKRKIANFERTGSPTLVVADTGCLMHILGGLHRMAKPQKVVHLAEVLNSR